MTEDQFWNIIAASRSDFDPARRDGNMELQEQRLEELLSELPPDEVREFGSTFNQLYAAAYRWDLWAAAYIIGGGCSDDSFAYFTFWLISMGREVYENALRDPEFLTDLAMAPGIEDCFFETFGTVADRVMEEGEIEPADFQHPEEPAGEKWQESQLPKLFPKLWAKFGEADA